MAVVWLVPGMATELPSRLFDHAVAASDERAPLDAPGTPRGSPVADDFSDLFDAPQPGRNPPYQDDFDDLLPPPQPD
jgi:hypothetical protein